MDIYLVLLFFANNEWFIAEGYEPLQMPNMETCDQRAEFSEEYLTSLDLSVKHHVLCLDTKGQVPVEMLKEYIKENLE